MSSLSIFFEALACRLLALYAVLENPQVIWSFNLLFVTSFCIPGGLKLLCLQHVMMVCLGMWIYTAHYAEHTIGSPYCGKYILQGQKFFLNYLFYYFPLFSVLFIYLFVSLKGLLFRCWSLRLFLIYQFRSNLLVFFPLVFEKLSLILSSKPSINFLVYVILPY